MNRIVTSLLIALPLVLISTSSRASAPEVLDSNYELTLFAAEPDIVTPIGAAFDAKGRLLIVECHTHFRPENYTGPAADRIRLVEDTDGDGKADRFRTFFTGTQATMSIARGPGDWIYVATRQEIFRIRDTDGDDRADEREDLVQLETKGNYPHNGLCGLAFDNEQRLYFGLGENLGEPYELVGRDGRRLRGGGEGGNIFQTEANGSELRRIATGFWNPFGICVDAHGRVFTVENDPDASPPCRLLQVVPGGDYGFQFRFGRSGKHPLQAWNGELPGTLPMMAGTGEAPCDLLPYDGQLWVTSWGEHRIERFQLVPSGVSWQAKRDIVVQGTVDFRPVDFAVAPEGTLFFTDWVDRSYPVHGQGRIWRLARKTPSSEPSAHLAELTPLERRARELQQRFDLASLKSADVYQRQAAIWGLLESGQLETLEWQKLEHPRQRLSLLQALRWRNLDEEQGRASEAVLTKALADPDRDVRLFAVRWAAEEGRADLRSHVQEQLDRDDLDSQLLLATLAALDWLDPSRQTAQPDPGRQWERLFQLAADASRPTELRALAVQMLPVNYAPLTVEWLKESFARAELPLQRELVRVAVLQSSELRDAWLAELAADLSLDAQLRADAVMGLALRADAYRNLLQQLAETEDPSGCEARRALRGSASLAQQETAHREKPGPEQVEKWSELVGEPGSPEAGWRVFFSSQAGNCGACHVYQGRGRAIGPDLTSIGRQLTRERLLESILQPSREVAPQYVPWKLQTEDGRTYVGLSLGKIGDERQEQFVASDGQVFSLPIEEIAVRRASEVSIMPQGFHETLTVQELRDLLALLHAP